MIDKNPQALAAAFKKTSGKILKIKELGITPEIDEESVELLIESLAQAKADADGTTLTDTIKGQRWYVEGLVKFSGLTQKEQLDAEYKDAFADSADEDEMIAALEQMAA
jgi:hypothetical protein